ncbi:MAG: FecR domain-containing protein [Mariniphaga sp.]|nr:FecR domain-containing protein [Mariniphaga sp.]
MKQISKYLEDKRFIQWVFEPDDELEAWWKAKEMDFPDERENIHLARRILQKLQTHDKELSDDEKILLFTRILKQVEEHHRQNKTRRIIFGIMRYAAVAVSFFTIGSLLFYEKDNFNPQFATFEITEPVSEEEAILVRPGGENIYLGEKRSHIEHRQDGHVIINDDVIESAASPEKGIPEMNQLIIPWGKTSEVILPDGTRVHLNAGSRLVYPEFFVDKVREVFLVGEAFFDVEHDQEKPFIVQTTDIRIRVLGTRFNVSAYPADNIIETVLAEGKVRLELNNTGLFSETTDISPGQLAAFHRTERSFKMKEVDVQHYTLWTEGLIEFESTDLSRVVKRLERYFNIRFRYRDPLLGGVKISGKLELTDKREIVLENVARAGSVKISQVGENFFEISR